MSAQAALEKILPAYESYYTVIRNDVEKPFAAQAEFRSHSEKFVLVKSAKIADIDSNEFVYFSTLEKADIFILRKLASLAWESGLKKVQPYNGHRNSDVTLIVVAESFSEEVYKLARKIKFSKNYMLGLYGWSNFKFAAVDLSAGKAVSNFQGRDIKKIFSKTGLLS